MANIFQGIVDQVKALGSLPGAVSQARQSKKQSVELEKKVVATNAFKDVAAVKVAPTATAERPAGFSFAQPVISKKDNVFSFLSPARSELPQSTTKIDPSEQAPMRLPFGKEGQNFPEVVAGAFPFNVATEVVSRTAEAVVRAPIKLYQSLRTVGDITKGEAYLDPSSNVFKEKPLKVPFDTARLGAPEGIESIQKRLLDHTLKLEKESPSKNFGDRLKKAAISTFSTVVPDTLDLIIATDVASIGAKQLLLKITHYDPVLDQALGKLGLQRGFSYQQFKDQFVKTGNQLIAQGDAQGLSELGQATRIISNAYTKGQTNFQLNKLGQVVQRISRAFVETPKQYFAEATSPLVLPKPEEQLPGYRPKPGQPKYAPGLRIEEIERVGGEVVSKPKDAIEAVAGMKEIPAVIALDNSKINIIKPPKPPTEKPVTEPAGAKERKFAEAVKESPETKPELKEELGKRDTTYTPLRNKTIIDEAKARVAESPESAVSFIGTGAEATPEQVATSVELIRHFQNSGKYTEAANVAETIAEKLTRAGQAVQAAKLYTHLSPETVLVRAQKLVQQINSRKFRWQKDIKLSDDVVKQISDLAKQMSEATDNTLKIELAEELESILRQIPRSGILRKISMIQTLAQLLNPKTILVRNPLGNELFYRLERISKYVSSPIDWARSTLTGSPRTVTFHTVKQGEFWSNWIKGFRAGWKGVTPGGLGTQFEIYAPAFKEKWNPLTYLEKSLGAALRSFDYAAYKRAVNQTLGELGWLRAKNEGLSGKALAEAAKKYADEAADEILKIADEYGRYITFQDNNAISKTLSMVKRGLNVGQEFGVGDLVIKYPRTPGALLMRALEYSPAGFIRSAYLIARPILKSGVKANIREIENALSRAIVGTLGLTGLGWYLADQGIITGKPSENRKVTGIQRAVGGGRYQINLSALERWVLSGFSDSSIQEGDRLYTYDWAQPVAVALSLGANMNEAVQEAEIKQEKRGLLSGAPGTAEASISGAVETITEQPLLTGLSRLFSGDNPVDAALAVVENMPSSFTPTILKQVGQVKDNVSRETWDSSMLKRSINKVKARLPVLAEDLPKRYDVFGKEQKAFEKPTLFNIFINPGFTSIYKPTPAAQLVIEIYNASGETKQLPKIVPRSLTFQGKSVQLSGAQISQFQKQIGQATDAIFTKLATDMKFKEAPNALKADMLNYALSKLYEAERFMILTQDQRKFLIESMSPEDQKSFVKSLESAL